MPAKPRIAPQVPTHVLAPIDKAPTGIRGLDDVTNGGLPRGRTTIFCGGPGSGKTMLGIEFLVRGAAQFDEPGVLIAFEESPDEIARNVASLGFNLNDLASRKKLFLDHICIDPGEIHETGEFDLEGLFIRLQHAVEVVHAKRVMLDTIEALFSSFANQRILRAELRRLFGWLKERGLTTVVTAEKGDKTLTREGLEEYVSDCVILLDHRVTDQTSVRRMRVVKYRGTQHGMDEYPFLIDESGMSVLPLSGLRLHHKVSNERVSSGIAALDEMLEGKGFYRGSSVLVSGTAGTGKTTLATAFASAVCGRGERCLYIGFEESPEQVARNVRSVGLDLEKWAGKELLIHEASRPTQYGLEMHLLRIHKLVEKWKPRAVVVDPVTNLLTGGSELEAKSMLMRLIDFLKTNGITALFVDLTSRSEDLESTDIGVSSLADSWILLRDVELNGERNRCIYVLKSRGMAHSNQVREFVISGDGIDLVPVYVGVGGVLTGSSRVAQQAKELAETKIRRQEVQLKENEALRKRLALEAQIAALQAELSSQVQTTERRVEEEEQRTAQAREDRDDMAKSRRAGSSV
ncbi:MAG: circadian clock protein KaiC [Candidatus Acidiferrales bacterium]